MVNLKIHIHGRGYYVFRSFLGLLTVALISTLSSCTSWRILPRGVVYQSCVSEQAMPNKVKPDSAKIKVSYSINFAGKLTVTITNLTTNIMMIDKTMSFFRGSDGQSISYYDPTVTTHTNVKSSTASTGVGVNLGTVANAVGIGGVVGRALNAVTVGGSNASTNTNSTTVYDVDQPIVNIGPRGQVELSKAFDTDLGTLKDLLPQVNQPVLNRTFTSNDSYLTFGAYITYSTDGGTSWDRIDCDFYANTLIVCKVIQEPGSDKLDMNSALLKLYEIKPDALTEPWSFIYFDACEQHLKKKTTAAYSSKSNSYNRSYTFDNYK